MKTKEQMMAEVKVVWDDAGSMHPEEGAWTYEADIPELYANANFINISHGFLVYENEDSVVIAQSRATPEKDHQAQYGSLLRIPRVNIKEIISLTHKAALMDAVREEANG